MEPADREVANASDVQAAEDRLLAERIRISATIVLVAIVGVFLAELILRPGERPGVTWVHSVHLFAVAFVLGLIRVAGSRRRNLLLAFFGYTATSLCVGAVGTITGDSTTALIVLLTVALGAAALIPWGTRWQVVGVLTTATVAVSMASTLVDSQTAFWAENVGGFVPTLIATLAVSYALERQRAVVQRFSIERLHREAILREAKLALEREIEGHKRSGKRLRFALRELDHRVKNTLAMVQSIAESTLETSQSPADFREAFNGRVRALARVHNALAAHRWKGLRLGELIDLVVRPCGTLDSEIVTDCEGVSVPSDVVRTLGMALHELATNAAKYGALSCTAGRVQISSRIESNDRSRLGCRLHLSWQELGGPPVVAPARRGLGAKLIEEGLAYESGGSVDLRFGNSGVRCDIDVPLPPS